MLTKREIGDPISFIYYGGERMAIWVTGDIHGGMDMHKLSRRELKRRGIAIGEGDYLIITGDLGLPFYDSDYLSSRGEYQYWMSWFRERPFTVLWVDGNHDNFNFWGIQPVTERYGGSVQIHPAAPNVIHLMRGEVYEIGGRTFFAFGGAASHDKEYRTPGHDWWAAEEASAEEIDNARKRLAKCGHKVDYIITHTPPTEICRRIRGDMPADRTASFLTEVMQNTEYRLWFCGHLHRDMFLNEERLAVLYRSVARIEDAESAVGVTQQEG